MLQHKTYLVISLQLPGVRNTSLVSRLGDSMVDEMKFVVRAKDRSEAVESIPLGDVVGQNRWLGVTVVWIYFDIEVICEYFFSVAGEDEGEEEEQGELIEMFLSGKEGSSIFRIIFLCHLVCSLV